MKNIPVHVIESSVPIPVSKEHIPVRELKVGQSVVFGLSERPYVQSLTSQLKRRRGSEYTVRKINDKEARVWRIK